MAETTNNDGAGSAGTSAQSTVDRALAFVKEPLGLGLVAGVTIALVLGYYIL